MDKEDVIKLMNSNFIKEYCVICFHQYNKVWSRILFMYTVLSNKHPLQPYIISPAQNIFEKKSFFLNNFLDF